MAIGVGRCRAAIPFAGTEACFHVARVGVEKREQDASAPVQVRRSPWRAARMGMVREAFSKSVPPLNA